MLYCLQILTILLYFFNNKEELKVEKLEREKFYITTPIYYSSGNLHLGHCCTSVFADAIARFKRLDGYDVFFLTGADEHGQKVEQRAKDEGVTPQQFVDELNKKYKELWKLMDISYDKYIRTTDEYHVKAVQKIFERLYEQGDIYKGKYEGWYCVSDEAYFTDSQAPDGICPDCHRPLKRESEECYFFKLSKYTPRLLKLYEEHPEFIRLETTKNEMLNGFLKPGLTDLSVTRSSFDWGIPVPFDKQHVIYVWIDALLNYLTALGYAQDDDTLFKKYWSPDLQLMAKEITRFHMIIWPAILMALDLPLPKLVHGHGWLTVTGSKMGKSLGNGFNPFVLVERYGVDAVRYYLLKDGPIMSDTPYSTENFLNRINSDLCNELGNLLSRTSAMIEQNFNGEIPNFVYSEDEFSKPLLTKLYNLSAEVRAFVDKQELNLAINSIWQAVRMANKYIEDTAPWKLKGDDSKREDLARILFNLQFSLFSVATVLQAFLPTTAKKILTAIGINYSPKLADINKQTYLSLIGLKVTKPEPLFPRLNINEEIKFIENNGK